MSDKFLFYVLVLHRLMQNVRFVVLYLFKVPVGLPPWDHDILQEIKEPPDENSRFLCFPFLTQTRFFNVRTASPFVHPEQSSLGLTGKNCVLSAFKCEDESSGVSCLEYVIRCMFDSTKQSAALAQRTIQPIDTTVSLCATHGSQFIRFLSSQDVEPGLSTSACLLSNI